MINIQIIRRMTINIRFKKRGNRKTCTTKQRSLTLVFCTLSNWLLIRQCTILSRIQPQLWSGVSTFIFIATIVRTLIFGFTFGLRMIVWHIFALTIGMTETLSVGCIHCCWTLTSDIMFGEIKLFHNITNAIIDVAIENINGGLFWCVTARMYSFHVIIIFSPSQKDLVHVNVDKKDKKELAHDVATQATNDQVQDHELDLQFLSTDTIH